MLLSALLRLSWLVTCWHCQTCQRLSRSAYTCHVCHHHGLSTISSLSWKWKWNESGFTPPLCTYRLNWVRKTSLRMVRWMRWHCPQDTGFEIRALAVWGRARYLSVTEAPHNTEFFHVGGEETCFVSFKPPGPGTEPRTLAWKGPPSSLSWT